jgi:hypothetical protein
MEETGRSAWLTRRSGRRRSGHAARQPALRRLSECVQIVWWPVPRGVPALMKWACRRLLFHQRQHRAEPFALGNRAELHALDIGDRTALLKWI